MAAGRIDSGRVFPPSPRWLCPLPTALFWPVARSIDWQLPDPLGSSERVFSLRGGSVHCRPPFWPVARSIDWQLPDPLGSSERVCPLRGALSTADRLFWPVARSIDWQSHGPLGSSERVFPSPRWLCPLPTALFWQVARFIDWQNRGGPYGSFESVLSLLVLLPPVCTCTTFLGLLVQGSFHRERSGVLSDNTVVLQLQLIMYQFKAAHGCQPLSRQHLKGTLEKLQQSVTPFHLQIFPNLE
jgi:hypothetical protein